MKFIFPENYNLKTRIFGLIEYSSAIFDLIWGIFVFVFLNILFKNISIKIFLLIVLVFPVVIFSIVGIEGDNLVYFLSYILKYIFKQKLYLYEKK